MNEGQHIDLLYPIPDELTELEVSFIDIGIKAGFPNPAVDYRSEGLDLNKKLIRHPATTFVARVTGDSLTDDGVNEGDLLIIDRSLTPVSGSLAVCFIDGEFVLKYIDIKKDVIHLIPANAKYPVIEVTQDNDFIVWGIVTHSIKEHLIKKI
jgi:DNA polymerase V